MKGIYLLLGSNLGNSRQILTTATNQIKNKIGTVIRRSLIYQTKAWGMEEQPDFLNQVLEVESDLEPHEILSKIHEIELMMGRKRKKKWGARLIDIDILYFGQKIIDSDMLSIPHPENQNRNFVLVPMCELAPDLVHPVLGQSQRELLELCADTLDVIALDGNE